MRVTTLHIKNLKCFADTGEIKLSPTINLLVGPNNSGKSTIIKALYLLQPPDSTYIHNYLNKNRRLGTNMTSIQIGFDEFNLDYINTHPVVFNKPENWKRKINIFSSHSQGLAMQIQHTKGNKTLQIETIPNKEPNNFIYPYLSKRKAVKFNEQVKAENALFVAENFQQLYSKIDRISNPEFHAYREYKKACKEILGFPISCSLSDQGKQAGLIINNEYIPIDEMGEGTINILGLLVNICIADDKLFLIEELENDIHPKALKEMLELIIKKSDNNQFVISTHSNIVTKYLGSAPDSKLFNFSVRKDEKIPLSKIQEVSNTPNARIKILENLGYELYDFELWKAYLILEESSAERIIRDFLIPTFVPGLKNKLKTIAAQGIDDISPRFHNFLILFVFVHSTSVYKNKAWIYVDGDESGNKTINKLRQKFNTWNPNHFNTFSKPNFEEYYPARWKERVNEALNKQDKKSRFKAKGELVNEIMTWTKANKREARKEFKESASEIIEILKNLEKTIK